jgi:phosphatidylserine/phosphatidylglycerophosphate/cardiolipin synthase-like enzyme
MLIKAGCQICFWRPIPCERGGAGAGDNRLLYDAKNHAKLLVIDGTVALVTDRNVGSCYFRNPHYTSVEVMLTGPIVQAMVQATLEMWAQVHQSAKADVHSVPALSSTCTNVILNAVISKDVVPVRGITASFVHSTLDTLTTADDPILHALLRLIKNAKVSIDCEYAYLVMPKPVQAAIQHALERGVRVRIISNSQGTNDLHWIHGATMASLVPVVLAGAQCHLAVAGLGHVHAKVTVVDGHLVLMGSWNMWLTEVFFTNLK